MERGVWCRSGRRHAARSLHSAHTFKELIRTDHLRLGTAQRSQRNRVRILDGARWTRFRRRELIHSWNPSLIASTARKPSSVLHAMSARKIHGKEGGADEEHKDNLCVYTGSST